MMRIEQLCNWFESCGVMFRVANDTEVLILVAVVFLTCVVSELNFIVLP